MSKTTYFNFLAFILIKNNNKGVLETKYANYKSGRLKFA